MARWKRTSASEIGGVARWVSPVEAREIADAFADVRTVADWVEKVEAGFDLSGADAGTYYKFVAGFTDGSEPFDRERAIASAVSGLARRRHFDATKAKPECPTCGEEIIWSGIWCPDHEAERDADVRKLLEASR